MFQCPMFNETNVKKEASAVNSEYQIDINEDSWKLQNLLTLLGKDNHPASRFSIGNIDTLVKYQSDISTQLQKFYDENYSSNKMALVIYSNQEPMEIMKKLRQSSFNKIENKNFDRTNFGKYGFSLDKKYFGNFVKMQTIQETSQLDIIVQIEPIQNYKYDRTVEFLSSFLEYKGQDGFQNFLISENLISDFEFGVQRDNSAFTNIQISFILNEQGVSQITRIIKAFNDYIDLILEHANFIDIWEQNKKLSNINFKYQSNINGGSYEFVSDIARKLNNIDSVSQILFDDHLYKDFNYEKIRNFLQSMKNIEQTIYVYSQNNLFDNKITLQKTDNKVQQKINEIIQNKEHQSSQLYNLQYQYYNIKNDLKNLNLPNEIKNKNIKLRNRNDYIPNDLTIKDPCDNFDKMKIGSQEIQRVNDSVQDPYSSKNYKNNFQAQEFIPQQCHKYEQNNSYPSLIIDNEQVQIFWLLDTQYKIPQTTVNLQFQTNVLKLSIKSYVLNNIWITLIQNELQQIFADAIEAGNMINIKANEQGFQLYLQAWSEKAQQLFQNVIQTIFNSENTQSKVLRALTQYKNYLQDLYGGNIIQLAMNDLRNLLVGQYLFSDIWANTQQQITLDEIIKYQQSFIDSYKVNGIVLGNILAKDAIQLFEGFRSKPKEQILQQHQIKNILGKNYLYTQQIQNENNAVLVSLQIGKLNMKDYSYLLLLENMLNNVVFQYLRTEKEQGYVAFARSVKDKCSLSLIIGCVGENNKPFEVDQYITNALQIFSQKINSLSEDELLQLKQSLVTQNQYKFKDLGDKSQFLFNFIYEQTFIFDFGQQVVSQIQKIDIKQLQEFWNKQKESFGRLSIQIYGKNSKQPQQMNNYTKISSEKDLLSQPNMCS